MPPDALPVMPSTTHDALLIGDAEKCKAASRCPSMASTSSRSTIRLCRVEWERLAHYALISRAR